MKMNEKEVEWVLNELNEANIENRLIVYNYLHAR